MSEKMQTIAEAARDGLAEEMRRDPSVWALVKTSLRAGYSGRTKGCLKNSARLGSSAPRSRKR